MQIPKQASRTLVRKADPKLQNWLHAFFQDWYFLSTTCLGWFNASRDRWAWPDDPRICEDARMHTRIDRHHVAALDSTMAYREMGASSRAVALFLHGNPTSSFIWRNVMPQVAPV